MDMKIQAGDESSKCLTDLSILILATQKEVNFIYAKAILFTKQIGGNRNFLLYKYCNDRCFRTCLYGYSNLDKLAFNRQILELINI